MTLESSLYMFYYLFQTGWTLDPWPAGQWPGQGVGGQGLSVVPIFVSEGWHTKRKFQIEDVKILYFIRLYVKTLLELPLSRYIYLKGIQNRRVKIQASVTKLRGQRFEGVFY